MKKLLFFLLLTSCFLLLTTPAYANGAGLPAFFKINDKLAISNPIQQFGITASSFLIPQDLAPEAYVAKQQIDFTIDEAQLQTVIPPELLKKTDYTWDFGDGTKAEGLQNSHSYSKIGSYILILTINIHEEGSASPTQFIDSFLLNIVPDKNYKNLPHAVIKLNNKRIDNPKTTLEEINFNRNFTLDASQSQSPSKIVQYLWNFGDGQTSTQPSTRHKYKKDGYLHVVVLRTKDSNGFISDAFVGIRNNTDKKGEITEDNNIIWITIGLSLLVLLVVGMLFRKKKNKK
jgi:LPXTG-motif cell wall-anchored protein